VTRERNAPRSVSRADEEKDGRRVFEMGLLTSDGAVARFVNQRRIERRDLEGNHTASWEEKDGPLGSRVIFISLRCARPQRSGRGDPHQ